MSDQTPTRTAGAPTGGVSSLPPGRALAALQKPVFSIIVPTYNRPRRLAVCLRALANLAYPRTEYEVIVVDDGSPSSLDGVVGRFKEAMAVTLLRQANAGPAAARNTGLAVARGQFVAFTDDDCAPEPGWISAFEAVMANDSVLAGGRCVNAQPDCPYATASQIIRDVVNAHFNCGGRDAMSFSSDNMASPRRLLQDLGGFDPGFRWSEDRDLCDRWRAAGGRLVHVPGARVRHAHEMGLGGFWRQHFGYGRGAWTFHRARARRRTGQLEMEGAFYARCFAEAMQAHPPHRALSLTALMVVWQLANTAGFVREAIGPVRSAQGGR